MNTIATAAALSLASFITFGVSAAAHQISAQQAQQLKPVGTISVSQVGGAPMDMRQALSKKAEQKGALAYHITEAHTGDTWHATAELYK
jgi:hypothetical protein